MVSPLQRIRLGGRDEYQFPLDNLDTNNGMQRPPGDARRVQQHAGQRELLIVTLNDLTISQKTFDILLTDMSLERSASGINAVFDSMIGEVSLEIFGADCHSTGVYPTCP
jgi:hypothetical protein